MTRAQEFRAMAEEFAARAASSKARTTRNTFLSLEQSLRHLAAQLAGGLSGKHDDSDGG